MLPVHLEHYGILIRCATRDEKPAWISLAEDVAEIFGNPNMPRDAEFHSYMEGKISKNEALIAVTQDTGECLGVIGFSKTHNRITWFGVFEKHRERGIGSELLRLALAQLDSSRSITVETYRAGYAPGEPARHVTASLMSIIQYTTTWEIPGAGWKSRQATAVQLRAVNARGRDKIGDFAKVRDSAKVSNFP